MKRVIGVLGVGLCLAVLMSVAPVQADDGRLTAVLNGPSERPGPGDPDAWGRAYITVNDASNQVCVTLLYARVDGTLSGLHIHIAPPTSPGPIVVPFATPTQQGSGVFQQCVTSENEALLDNIAANPSQYYINLHSAPNFGPGAIRGQLQGL
ncbi:MAG: CHRD domain-containing protein [Acidimicrobiales bacterium]